jgi:hypothetical protein
MSLVKHTIEHEELGFPTEATDISGKLDLDQTTPQTIENGIPLLESSRTIDSDNQLVDKKYVDDNDIAKITTLDKTANYANYAIVDSGWKYTFNRTDNIITSVTKEAV